MDDHFDTSGVFEISKFDISKFACMSVQEERMTVQAMVLRFDVLIPHGKKK